MASPIRAVVLDVMSTIVTEPFLAVVPQALGMSLEEIIEHKHPTAWVDFEKGLLTEEAFAATFFADGRDYDHEGMREAMVAYYDYLPGMEALLQELNEAGVPLHLMSNYPCWYQRIENKLELSRYAAWTFVSCEVGLRKPDPEAYRWVAREVGMAPEALLFVDDRGSNCKAAVEVGMDAIRFESAEALRAGLVERGLLG